MLKLSDTGTHRAFPMLLQMMKSSFIHSLKIYRTSAMCQARPFFFFLMWTIFKVFIEFVTIFFSVLHFCFLTLRHTQS